ncbi:MAG: hypothetical protein QM756_06525 [Polyangiaceae bacterium]
MSNDAGRRLLSNSFSVLKRNKKLYWFLVAAAAVSSLLQVLDSERWTALVSSFRRLSRTLPKGEPLPPFHDLPQLSARLVAESMLSVFALTLLNVALYSELLLVLGGRKVSVRRGLWFAVGRVAPIASWTLFAGAVESGLQLAMRGIGPFGSLLLQLSWFGLCLFVTPVLVRERRINPLRVLKISISLVRETWHALRRGLLAQSWGVGSQACSPWGSSRASLPARSCFSRRSLRSCSTCSCCNW